MSQKILVAYATRLGTTVEVAEAIGEELRRTGAAVDVACVADVNGVNDYDAVVVGSAIRVGHWLPEAVEFVKQHRKALSRIPTAYFVVCITMSKDTPENREIVLGYLKPVLDEIPDVKPVDIGLFGGAVDVKRLAFPLRFMIRLMHVPQGDFRDWQAIHAWADYIQPMLTLEPASLN